MFIREDGYLSFSDKDHKLARADGSVLLHRSIYAEYYDDYELDGYHIHHIDGNKLNNNPDNLEKLSAVDHLKSHCNYREINCIICNTKFHAKGDWHKCCSAFCRKQHKISTAIRKYHVHPNLLRELSLVYPMTKLGEMFGVSDVAIKKRLKTEEIYVPYRFGVRPETYKLYIYELLK